MNSSHSVRFRPKTLARVRSIAQDLETSVSAVVKHAVEEAVTEAWKNRRVAVPIRAQKADKAREPLESVPQSVKLDPEIELRLRALVAQTPLLKTSSVIRGAVERFVEAAFREKQVVFRVRIPRANTRRTAAGLTDVGKTRPGRS